MSQGKHKKAQKNVFNLQRKGGEKIIYIYQKIKCIDKAKFMASSLSSIVDNFVEGIHKIKCKDCDSFLEQESVKDNSINNNCISCSKGYSNRIDEVFKKI